MRWRPHHLQAGPPVVLWITFWGGVLEGGSWNGFVPKSNFDLERPKFDFCNPPELLPDKTLDPPSQKTDDVTSHRHMACRELVRSLYGACKELIRSL